MQRVVWRSDVRAVVRGCRTFRMLWVACDGCDGFSYTVADLGGGGVRGVQLHPPLAASNVFSHAYISLLLESISSGIQQQL